MSSAQRTASTALGNSASAAFSALLSLGGPLRHQIVEDGAGGGEAPRRLALVLRHEPAVARDIGRQNG